MDLFSLIDENGPLHPVSPDLIRRLQHRSPLNSPSRLSMPDLSETDQSASEGEKDLPNVSVIMSNTLIFLLRLNVFNLAHTFLIWL